MFRDLDVAKNGSHLRIQTMRKYDAIKYIVTILIVRIMFSLME